MDFGRYLIGELFWELDKFQVHVPGLTDVSVDQIEVLSFKGYDSVRLRVGSTVFEANLAWGAQTPPTIAVIREVDH